MGPIDIHVIEIYENLGTQSLSMTMLCVSFLFGLLFLKVILAGKFGKHAF